MLPDGRRLGAHLPVAAGFVKAVDRAHTIGASALQVFGDNPTAWKRRTEPPADLVAFRERLAELDIAPLAIHGAYLINLAGPVDEFFERSIDVLRSELASGPAFGASFLNIHTGSHRNTGVDAGIGRLADGVATAIADVDGGADATRLVLENSAGGGFGIGVDVIELAAIADAIAARGVAADRVGFCLDAAHLWAAGHNVSEPDGVDQLIDDFDRHIGLERLAMIHLNDSKSELGSRHDRHEHLGAGQIGERGLARLLRHPRLGHVVYYLETPGMDEGYDAVNVARAHDLAAGRALAQLPPEALTIRGSRSRDREPEPV